jgi:hypothetical protein
VILSRAPLGLELGQLTRRAARVAQLLLQRVDCGRDAPECGLGPEKMVSLVADLRQWKPRMAA